MSEHEVNLNELRTHFTKVGHREIAILLAARSLCDCALRVCQECECERAHSQGAMVTLLKAEVGSSENAADLFSGHAA